MKVSQQQVDHLATSKKRGLCACQGVYVALFRFGFRFCRVRSLIHQIRCSGLCVLPFSPTISPRSDQHVRWPLTSHVAVLLAIFLVAPLSPSAVFFPSPFSLALSLALLLGARINPSENHMVQRLDSQNRSLLHALAGFKKKLGPEATAIADELLNRGVAPTTQAPTEKEQKKKNVEVAPAWLFLCFPGAPVFFFVFFLYERWLKKASGGSNFKQSRRV